MEVFPPRAGSPLAGQRETAAVRGEWAGTAAPAPLS
mgnify:CR=1 FL=1